MKFKWVILVNNTDVFIVDIILAWIVIIILEINTSLYYSACFSFLNYIYQIIKIRNKNIKKIKFSLYTFFLETNLILFL
jgi:hypothetical protein